MDLILPNKPVLTVKTSILLYFVVSQTFGLLIRSETTREDGFILAITSTDFSSRPVNSFIAGCCELNYHSKQSLREILLILSHPGR